MTKMYVFHLAKTSWGTYSVNACSRKRAIGKIISGLKSGKYAMGDSAIKCEIVDGGKRVQVF